MVGGVVNWLNNLAQSNRQMNIDNDWVINLQVSHTTEIPRGFGKDDDLLVADVDKIPSSSFCSRSMINLNVPRPSYDVDVLNGDEDEEERLFGPVSDSMMMMMEKMVLAMKIIMMKIPVHLMMFFKIMLLCKF